jgi:hypothetical protein
MREEEERNGNYAIIFRLECYRAKEGSSEAFVGKMKNTLAVLRSN